MAGLTITVGGNDITAYVDVRSLSIEEVGTELVASCSFEVRDHSGTVSISTKDIIDIDDDGTAIFAGEVAILEKGQEGVAKLWKVKGQDHNILLEETVVVSESYALGTADSAIIADLFTDYRSDIDSSTYVATLDASMEAVAFAAMTLREILDDLARRCGARYYVDYSKNLHWFSTESNNAAFGLSTSPDGSTTYGFGDFLKVEDATRIADKVLVLGKEVSGWYPSGVPDYDGTKRHGVSRDQRVETAQGVTDRGTAIYNRFNAARETYTLWTEKDGLRAGQSVAVTNETWGISAESFYIRRITTEIISKSGDKRRYHLELNDESPDPARVARQSSLIIATIESVVNSVSDTIFDTDAPSAPDAIGAGNVTTGVSLDADGHQIVYLELTWSEVSDSDLDHYQVQLSTQSDFTSDIISRIHPAGGSRHERFAGLLGNTTYYVRVRATDWVGNDSAWDYGEGSAYDFTSSRDSTAPDQVAGLSAAASRTLIGLSWTANTEADLAFYEIQRDDDNEGAPAGTWATIAKAHLSFYVDQDFSDAEIAAEDTFWYRVRAVDTSANDGDWADQTSAALSQIAADHLAAGCITTVKLFAGAVTAEKITVSELSAIAADLGTITAGTVTGATIRTAASGARVQMNSTDGLQCYNSGSTLCAQIDVDGSGQIGATGGTVPPLTWNAAGQIDRIQANQLDIGEFLFNQADGLLLLGPNCEITATTWKSLRGQVATLSGAFHQTQGMWLGTRGLVVEEATTNLCINPSIETNTTGWAATAGATLAKSDDYAVFGDYALKVTPTANVWDGTYWRPTTLVSGQTYIASVWVKGVVGISYYIALYDETAAAYVGAVQGFTGTGQWQRVTTVAGVAVGNNPARLYINKNSSASTGAFYVDGAQIEQKGYATTYCDGSLGSGYAWTGTAHASTSTRTVAEVNLDAHVGLISENATLSFRVVAQMPYAADGTWPVTNCTLVDAIKDDTTERILLFYYPSDDKFYVNLLDGGAPVILSSSAQTFVAGDWADIVVTIDYTSDEYNLYVNGVLEDTSTDTTTPPVIEQWNLGSYFNATNQIGAAFCELGVFDTVMTAAQVSQLFELQQPLVDTGAIDRPGIYILDGKFRISSSTTGARIEITADAITGYDSSGTAQFYLQASDGKALAGGGAVYLDELGINVNMDAGAGLIQFLKSGTQRGRVYGDTSGAIPQVWVMSGEAPASNSARLMLYAESPANVTTGIRIASSGGETATIALRLDGSSAIILDTDWFEYQTGVMSGLKPSSDETGYVGSGAVGWYEMNAKSYVDIGCLGWFDDGVELVGGEVVGDCEALMRVRRMEDGTLTMYDVPKLDYSTLPRVVYKPVFDEETGEKIKDRAELTSLISVMVSAIRELTRDVRALKEAQ